MINLNTLVLTVFAALATASLSCRAPLERCAGSPGYPAVDWAGGCCAGSCSLVLPDTWGTFCTQQPAPAPSCYPRGERSQGAPGQPEIPWRRCCEDGDVPAPREGTWGLFCTARAEIPEKACVGAACGKPTPCYATGERAIGELGRPQVMFRPCCLKTDVVASVAGQWGKFCVAPGGEKKVGSWQTLVTNGLPVARHEATFVMGDLGKAYLLGGRGLRNISIFDTASLTWTSAPPPPIEIHHFQAVFASSLIWIPSAWSGGFPRETNVEAFYTYNTITGEWATRTPLPLSRQRGSAAVAFYKGKLYVAMGNRGGHGEQATSLAWFDEYDIATDTWRPLPDAPVARDHTGGGIVNGKFVIAGGRDGGRANFFNLNTPAVNSFNFATGLWETGPDFPTPRAGSSYGVTCDGHLMVAGGEGAGQAYNNVDVFDGTSWAPTTFLNTSRHGSGLAIGECGKCSEIFVASGSGAQGGSPELQSTEKYSTC